MALLLDILLIAVLLLFVFLGAKRGFVLTLCSLLAAGAAFLGGRILADTLAPAAAGFLRPILEETIQEVLEEQAGSLHLEDPWDSLTDSQALNALKEQGGVFSWAAEQIEETLSSVNFIPTAASIAADVAAAAAERLAHGILFSIGFFLILLVWNFLSHALDLFTRLPILHSFNELFGGLLGLVKGLLIVYIAAWLLCSLTGLIPPEMVAQTKLLRLLTAFNPWKLSHLRAPL